MNTFSFLESFYIILICNLKKKNFDRTKNSYRVLTSETNNASTTSETSNVTNHMSSGNSGSPQHLLKFSSKLLE